MMNEGPPEGRSKTQLEREGERGKKEKERSEEVISQQAMFDALACRMNASNNNHSVIYEAICHGK